MTPIVISIVCGLVAIIDSSNTENVVKRRTSIYFFQYKFWWLHHIVFVAELKSVRVIYATWFLCRAFLISQSRQLLAACMFGKV
jgi:hypothetical protein